MTSVVEDNSWMVNRRNRVLEVLSEGLPESSKEYFSELFSNIISNSPAKDYKFLLPIARRAAEGVADTMDPETCYRVLSKYLPKNWVFESNNDSVSGIDYDAEVMAFLANFIVLNRKFLAEKHAKDTLELMLIAKISNPITENFSLEGPVKTEARLKWCEENLEDDSFIFDGIEVKGTNIVEQYRFQHKDDAIRFKLIMG